MKVTIEINCDNAAFEDDPSLEVARILKDVCKKIDGHPNFSDGFSTALFDINGNEVGYLSVKEEQDGKDS